MFIGHKTVYVKILKNQQKLLKLISNYIKVAGHKANTQKSITFLYTSNEQVKFEIKNTLPLVPPPNEITRYKSNKTCTGSI